MVVLLTVRVRQSEQLLEQKRVLEDPLDGLDEVRLKRGRVLLPWVLDVQERLERRVRLGWKSQTQAVGGTPWGLPSLHSTPSISSQDGAETGQQEEYGESWAQTLDGSASQSVY